MRLQKGCLLSARNLLGAAFAAIRFQNVQLEYLLLRYALERFLYRLGESAYVDRFILKGASAFAVWLGPLVRVTRDADVEAFGFEEPEAVVGIFKDVCSLACPFARLNANFALAGVCGKSTEGKSVELVCKDNRQCVEADFPVRGGCRRESLP